MSLWAPLGRERIANPGKANTKKELGQHFCGSLGACAAHMPSSLPVSAFAKEVRRLGSGGAVITMEASTRHAISGGGAQT